MTRVVNLRYEACDVKICRLSLYGNPFYIGRDGTRKQVIEKYRKWILNQPHLLAQLHTLKGRLGCWCKPLPCHGDVLLELINGMYQCEQCGRIYSKSEHDQLQAVCYCGSWPIMPREI